MKFKVERNKFQTLLDPCVTPVLEAPGDSAEPGDRFQDLEISNFQLLEEESVRFRGHQAEVAMITITACSYLTLGDPPTTPWVTPPPNNNQKYLRFQDSFKSSVP